MNWKEFFLGKQPQPDRPINRLPVIDQGLLQSRGYSTDEARFLINKIANNPREHFNLLEGRLGMRQDDILRLDYDKEKSIRDFTKGTFNLSNTLVAMWTQAQADRKSYMLMSAELRKFYIVLAILNLLAQDVLNADDRGDILVISSKNKDAQKKIDELTKNLDFNMLISEIARDLIDYGEYALRMELSPGKGLVGVYDDVDTSTLLAFYEQGLPTKFLVYKDRDYKVVPAHFFAHFVVGNTKMRINLDDQLDMWSMASNFSIPEKVRRELPDYVRVGEPLFMGMIPKLKELQLLEQLIPATKLNQITQSQMVSMQVPAGMAPEKVMEALKRYEQMLNVPTGLNSGFDQISLSEIMTVSGKIRIVPHFSDEKGGLAPLNLRENPPVDDILNAIKDIRAVILSSLGIPPSLLYGSVDQEKASELRLFSRYTRRLASIQQALARGVKQLVIAHLVNSDIEITADDIEVIFKQSLVDLSGLEKLEFDDAKQEIVGRTIDFLNKMFSNQLLRDTCDQEALLKWVQSKFDILTDGVKLFDAKNVGKNIVDLAPVIDPGTDGRRIDRDSFASEEPLDLDDNTTSKKSKDD